jgi:hypothetical protein
VLNAVERGCDVNAAEDWSLLLWATFHRHAPTILRLLARGADPNLADNHRRSPTWCVLERLSTQVRGGVVGCDRRLGPAAPPPPPPTFTHQRRSVRAPTLEIPHVVPHHQSMRMRMLYEDPNAPPPPSLFSRFPEPRNTVKLCSPVNPHLLWSPQVRSPAVRPGRPPRHRRRRG